MLWQTLTRGVLFVALILAGAAWAYADEDFHGQVVSSSGGELTISAGGQPVRFAVAPEAVITIDGQEAVLAELTPDHVADVTAKRKGENWVAMTIEARSQRVLRSKLALTSHPEQ